MAEQVKIQHTGENDRSMNNSILKTNNSEAYGENAPSLPLSRNQSKHAALTDPIRNQNFSFTDGEKVDAVSRYAKECLQYQKCIFDDRIKLLIHRMSIMCYHHFKDSKQHPFLAFFLQRVLTTLAKKLLLNKFQLLFLQYILQETKWNYDTDIITLAGDQFKPFAVVGEGDGQMDTVGSLQAYLLFCAYFSKKALGEGIGETSIAHFVRNISQHFKDRYQEWIQQSGVTRVLVNPKIFNTIFRRLTSFQEKQKDFFQNYNVLVEEIIQISPAYNNVDKKKGRKKMKLQQSLQKTRPIRSLLAEESSPAELPVLPRDE